MKTCFAIVSFLSVALLANAQSDDKAALRTLGYSSMAVKYKTETINALFKKSKVPSKSLIVYAQGSLARPLIIKDGSVFNDIAFPFNTDSVGLRHDIVVLSKPFIPIIASVDEIDERYEFVDSITGLTPKNFSKFDRLDYMSDRLKFFIKKMSKDYEELILLGHSEGSRVVVAAGKSRAVNKIVHLSGNPYGRYMNEIYRTRKSQLADNNLTATVDSTSFDFYKDVLKNRNVHDFNNGGDSSLKWHQYSQPYDIELLKLKKPIFIGYGSQDRGALFTDLLQQKAIENGARHIHFSCYLNLEHSFFAVDENGVVNYEQDYWDIVTTDILQWIETSNIDSKP